MIYKVLNSNSNTYLVSDYYSLLNIIICLHTVIWFWVPTNNALKELNLQVTIPKTKKYSSMISSIPI